MGQISAGRLLCVGIRGAVPGDNLLEQDLEACAEAGVGGVILFDVDVPQLLRLTAEGLPRDEALMASPRNVIDPEQLAKLIAHVRARLGVEVLVTVDQEGGQVARLNPRRGFEATPTAAEFARLDVAAQQAVAQGQAKLMQSLGVDLNYAPCTDLALEPLNDIIVGHGRSYGVDPQVVIQAAQVVIEAHHAAGVGACLKHFPGHGSSRGDTHLDAVDITDTWQRDAELTPYHSLAHLPGLAIMVAHVMHRGLDGQWPASLSAAVVGGILRREIGFQGVVVTDSIDMRAITGRWTPEQAAVAAIDAGVDLVVDGFNLMPDRAHPAVALRDAVQSALEKGNITGGHERIAASCARLDRLRRQLDHTAGPDTR